MAPITFPGTLDSLARIRQVVGDEAQRVGLSKKAAYRLLLAVDEIATNIIVHGYEENNVSGTIDLLLEHADGWLTVTLEDDAVPFDPLQHQRLDDDFLASPLEDRPIGGMGIHLTLNGVDEFRYEYAEQRNRNQFRMKTDG